MKKIVILAAVLLCLFSALFAEEKNMAPLGYGSTAGNALGGPHVAYTDNIYSLFVNPAALQWANESIISDLSFSVTGPFDKLLKKENKDSIKNLLNAMGDDGNESALGDALSSLTNIMPGGKLPVGAEIRGPLSFGYTANGFGLGLFMRTLVDARIIGTSIDANVYADITLPFGMSFNILRLKDHELSTGFVIKPYARVWASMEADALNFIGGSPELPLDIPVIAGAASDLGLMYRFKKDLVVGLTASDVYTFGLQVTKINIGENSASSSNVTYRVPFGLNPGIAYTFRPSSFWEVPGIFQSFYTAVMFDWTNFQRVFTWNNREHRNPLLDVGAGMEIGLFGFLKFRAGVHELLPSVGFGLEPSVFKLNFAIYGKELGSEPGVNSTLGADLSITFRPDTKKRNWVWTKPMIQ
ncbi:MAG: hypothetical protein LBI94_03570 [Treponema sp.]|jgi:hypothetical protein|nr:hypothetical protein [Treponema sp.]